MSLNLSSSLQLPGLSINNSLSIGNQSSAPFINFFGGGAQQPQTCFPQTPPRHAPPHHHHHHRHHHHGHHPLPRRDPALDYAQNLGQNSQCCTGGCQQAPRQGGLAFAMMGVAF